MFLCDSLSSPSDVDVRHVVRAVIHVIILRVVHSDFPSWNTPRVVRAVIHVINLRVVLLGFPAVLCER